MNPALLNSQFIQVALPIVLTIFIAAWLNGRSIDGVNKRLDDINKHIENVRTDLKAELRDVRADLKAIDGNIIDYGRKIAALEERTSPLGRR